MTTLFSEDLIIKIIFFVGVALILRRRRHQKLVQTQGAKVIEKPEMTNIDYRYGKQ